MVCEQQPKKITEIEQLVKAQKQAMAVSRDRLDSISDTVDKSDITQRNIEKSLKGFLEELEWRTLDFRRIPRY